MGHGERGKVRGYGLRHVVFEVKKKKRNERKGRFIWTEMLHEWLEPSPEECRCFRRVHRQVPVRDKTKSGASKRG